MVEPVSAAERQRLRELAAKTALPWRWGRGRSEVLCEEGVLDANGDAVSVNCGRGAGDWSPEEAEYAVLAANLAPRLLDALEEEAAPEDNR